MTITTFTDRTALLESIDRYVPDPSEERDIKNRFISFISSHEDCAERSNLIGHLTGSGWVISADGESVLLLYHAKLGRWLQPGGHADGDLDLHRVARREVGEETGISDLTASRGAIFDLDIHQIPERHDVPAHLHYDVRYLFRAPPGAEPIRNSESHAIRWVALRELTTLSVEYSLRRMAEKCRTVQES